MSEYQFTFKRRLKLNGKQFAAGDAFGEFDPANRLHVRLLSDGIVSGVRIEQPKKTTRRQAAAKK